MLPSSFRPFLQEAPFAVMARAVVERLIDPKLADQWFEEHAVKQYQRDLPFSVVVELMQSVVLGVEPNVYSAYSRRKQTFPVSDQALYDKLRNIETAVSAAAVSGSAARAGALINELGGGAEPWLPGYRTRVLDGNHLSATERRAKPLRQLADKPLPGTALVVLEPETGLATRAFLMTDGHASERSFLSEVAAEVEANDLWIADRNFCVASFMFQIADAGAAFVIRRHQQTAVTPLDARRLVAADDRGQVFETRAVLVHGERELTVRLVTIELSKDTRDGTRVVHMLTNLPPTVDAATCVELYKRRWSIERLFQEVTQTLRCEIKTLCYPKAALFAFCLALAAANSVAVLKAALAAAQGAEEAARVSPYYITLEIRLARPGMMMVLPPERWRGFGTMREVEFACWLRDTAATIDLSGYLKAPRGPKKPQPPRQPRSSGGHVSTYKVLKGRI